MECAYSLNGALCGLVNNPTGSGFIYHPGIVDEVFDVKSLQEWKGQRLNPVFPSLSSPLGTFVFLPFSHTGKFWTFIFILHQNMQKLQILFEVNRDINCGRFVFSAFIDHFGAAVKVSTVKLVPNATPEAD